MESGLFTQTQRVVPGQFSSTYTETEELNKKMPDGHDIFDEKSIYTTTGYTDIYTDTLDIKYQKQGTDSKYTNLQKPKDMVGGNGYINVYNEAGNLSLSCAMSQLGVKLDDDLVGYSMYYDSKITKSTTSSPDGNVAETTFQLGKNVKAYPDIAKTVYEHGFEIASHSWDHPDLRKLDTNAVNKQIVDTQNAIFNITGDEPSLIRPPYGAFNDNVKTVVKNNGMQIALWTVDTLDWKLKDANKVKDAIVNNAYDGAVVLIHDIHNFTVDGLEMALAELANKGYQFVTLSTLGEYKELKTVLR